LLQPTGKYTTKRRIEKKEWENAQHNNNKFRNRNRQRKQPATDDYRQTKSFHALLTLLSEWNKRLP
jgi:hypothetical protein